MATLLENPPLRLHPPAYYEPDDGNDQAVKKGPMITRVLYAALPFIALHKPFGKILTLTMDATRTISSFSQFLNQKDSAAALKTIIAITALAGTVFMHPLGLSVSILHELISNFPDALAQLQAGDLQGILVIAQHGLYLGTLFVGSLEIIALSLLCSVAVELSRSRKEFQEGYLLEGVAHLLMSMVRFGQSLPYMANSARERNLRCQPLLQSLDTTVSKMRDRAALFFYSSARSSVTPLWKSTSLWLETLSHWKNPLLSTPKKIASVAKSSLYSAALLPFTLSGLVLGQIFHFTAFQLQKTPYIHLKGDAEGGNGSDPTFSLFQLNCCLTAGGFARLFGGLELSNEQRVEEIVKMIKESCPDVACLQEVSDLQDALLLYEKLRLEFTDFYLNIGATPFILQNNSGLFV